MTELINSFVNGKKIERLFAKNLRKNNFQFKREPYICKLHPDYLIAPKIIVEMTIDCQHTNLDALCFHSMLYREEKYITALIVPFSKVSPIRMHFLVKSFNFVFDMEDFGNINKIISLLTEALNYKNEKLEQVIIMYEDYLKNKSNVYSRLRNRLLEEMSAEYDK